MSDSDNDSIDESNLPTREECEERCQQFAAVTSTDTALAMFYLQDRQWDLQKALDAFFLDRDKTGSGSGEKKDEHPTGKSKTASDVATSSVDDETDDDDADIPSKQECEERCQQFAAVTSTDTALAMSYLQDRKWNLQKALDAFFFEHDKKASTSAGKEKDSGANKSITSSSAASEKNLSSSANKRKLSDTGEEERNPKSSKKEDVVKYSAASDPQPHRVRILSWNIDGLDQSHVTTRAKAVADTIVKERPDAVFLQEVVAANLAVLREHCPGYKILLGSWTGNGEEAGTSCSYYTAILLNNNTVQYSAHDVQPFYSSTMGRSLLTVSANIKGVDSTLMTSHLESTASHAAERKRQLKIAFDKMSATDKQQTVVFGGDLNLRDKELTGASAVPKSIGDVWEDTGKRVEAAYTWDLKRNDNLSWEFNNKPRCRFDRLYYRQTDRLRPVYFELIGLERIAGCRRFPSDHWGILAHFDIKS